MHMTSLSSLLALDYRLGMLPSEATEVPERELKKFDGFGGSGKPLGGTAPPHRGTDSPLVTVTSSLEWLSPGAMIPDLR
jgi:hypothetical protein